MISARWSSFITSLLSYAVSASSYLPVLRRHAPGRALPIGESGVAYRQQSNQRRSKDYPSHHDKP
jgi:hypothetical protein